MMESQDLILTSEDWEEVRKLPWISVHKSVDGPKLRNLYKKLNCSKFEATGILNYLWFWGLENAQKDGLILYADKEDIARHLFGVGVGCKMSMDVAVDALIETGWIDQIGDSLFLHDWEQWQAQWYAAVMRREKDANRKRESRKRDAENKIQGDAPELLTGSDGFLPPDNPPEGGEKKEKPKYSVEFETFWQAYPNKKDKGMAYKKYQARRKDGFTADELLLAAQEYAKECRKKGTAPEYIKHPKTFLSDVMPFIEYLPKKPQPVILPGANPFKEAMQNG